MSVHLKNCRQTNTQTFSGKLHYTLLILFTILEKHRILQNCKNSHIFLQIILFETLSKTLIKKIVVNK